MTAETTQDGHSAAAVRGGKYPIRLLNCVSGNLIIGFIIEITDGAIMVLRPYEVQYDMSHPDKDGEQEIVSYNLCPYLNQLIEYDPCTLDPVPFMVGSVESLPVPSATMRQLYMSQTQLSEFVATHPGKSQAEVRSETETPTIH